MDYSWAIKYLTEALGTAIIVIFGNSAATLARKGNGRNQRAIAGLGFGIGLTIATMLFGAISAQLNPAVTIGFAVSGFMKWNQVWEYVIAQVLGAIVGQLIVVAMQYHQFQEMESATLVLSAFATIPEADDRTYAKRNIAMVQGAVSEFFASFVFVFGIMGIIGYYIKMYIAQYASQAAQSGTSAPSLKPSDPNVFAQAAAYAFGPSSSIGAIGIGLLGGALIWFTGSALNPARDFGPRLLHSLLPASALSDAKDDSRWWYGWIPVVMPILAGIAAIALYKIMYLK